MTLDMTHPTRAAVHVEGIGEQQERGLRRVFEADGYTVTVVGG